MFRLISRGLRWFGELPPHTTLGMPSLSPTMTTGTIMKWLKKEGEKVSAGEVMFEVETDKATLGFDVQDEVYVAKILAAAGSPPLPIGAPIAILVDKADRVAAFKDYILNSGPKATEAPKAEPEKVAEKPSKLKMSPAAHHMVDVMHLDPSKVTATGPKGLILKEDVIHFVADQSKEESKSAKPAAAPEEKAPKPKSAETSPTTASTKIRPPRFSVSSNINLEAILKLVDHQSLNAFFIKAATVSCLKVPEAHSKFFPEFTRFYDYVDVQVFNYDNKGVKKYFIQDSQSKRVEDIKELLNAESSGNYNFAVSFGSANEIATPEASALLSIGGEEKAVVKEGEALKVNRVLKATLNCDHRAVDGAVGANWLKQFKSFIENPISVL